MRAAIRDIGVALNTVEKYNQEIQLRNTYQIYSKVAEQASLALTSLNLGPT